MQRLRNLDHSIIYAFPSRSVQEPLGLPRNWAAGHARSCNADGHRIPFFTVAQWFTSDVRSAAEHRPAPANVFQVPHPSRRP